MTTNDWYRAVLLLVAVFMTFRQLGVFGVMIGAIAKQGRFTPRFSWWIHLVATSFLVTAAIVAYSNKGA